MSNTQQLVMRETTPIKISELGGGQEFLHPEKVTVKLDPRIRVSPFDFGSLAYAVRESRGYDGFAVLETSLVEGRREILRIMLDHLSVVGNRDTSILTYLRNVEIVISWCNENGHIDALLTPEASRLAYKEYTEQLNHKMLVECTLQPLTCIQRQRAFRCLIELVHRHDATYVLRGVLPIKVNRKPRTPPREADVRAYLDICIRIATQFSTFLLEGQPYPMIVQFSHYQASIFPFHGAVATPYSQIRKDNVLSPDGTRVATAEEYSLSNSWCKPSEASRQIADTHRVINLANTDFRHDQRMWAASMAMGAYACIFSLITGAGVSEFVEFEYDDAVEIEQSLVKKELTTIKFRARGLTTRYPIGRGRGRQLLRSYLKFRAWVLNGAHCDYLFFTMKKSGRYSGEYDQLPVCFSTRFFGRIKGTFLPSDAKNIPPGAVRKFKSLILHELRVSPSLIADSLNHTQSVNASSYSEVSVDKAQDEFSTYWQAIRKAAGLVRDRPTSPSTPTVVGHCNEIDTPVKIIQSAPIEPNCTSQYGCLYCANYMCHADDDDVHKLLSLHYVINSVRNTAQDIGHAERLFRDLSIRINVIIEAVASRSAEKSSLVAEVKQRVDQLGILTPFWEKRLQRYEKLGVVF
jgi:hypothetical protein